MKTVTPQVAYFSMEFAFHNDMPNYAGGLGVLAADMMHSCADMSIPIVGVSLMYHHDEGVFDPTKYLTKRKETVTVIIENRSVRIDLWQMNIEGISGYTVPVIFLSTNTPENPKWDRDLTKYLYSSNPYTRFGQEAILGIGGVRALKALGFEDIGCYHLNEGHSSCLTLELLRRNHYDEAAVKKLCTFTTHTPIAAGHDYFDYDLVYKTLNKIVPLNIKELATGERMGMTQLALNLSRTANSVSEKHREVCRDMFPSYTFENVTNGIYHNRWAGDPMKALFTKYLKNWQKKPEVFSQARSAIPDDALVTAHNQQKKALIEWINAHLEFFPYPTMLPEDLLEEDVLTIAFARRFVPYKRPDLIFHDIDRLRDIGYRKVQMIFAGHCHPDDAFCNNLKDKIKYVANILRGQIKIIVLPEYNLNIAKRLVTGADIWLNNPVPPLEASGTSGMKAALNGVLNASVLDGWWIEGHGMEPHSGWAFGSSSCNYHMADREAGDNDELLKELVDIIDCYYERRDEWIESMKASISLLAHFSTNRVVEEYCEKIWKVKACKKSLPK